ncbi:fungal-specific transcription factor domain-containing protein [Chaetomium tenue]|uniref:Fungal-specific transcription factor domain-containing protein n=1 Tax=Chaetomium tenue TaxID=1854479 RepID=A0ACB7P0N5_9PEZI|nr:fungal-specific transcription factor domain-containing protein [Chaetomium globosum]
MPGNEDAVQTPNTSMQGLEPLDRAPVAAKPRACHNCRRRRLRCDRSFPSCRKCSISGENCLGYGTLLRWANAPAVRGKLVGQLAVTKTGKLGPKPVSVPPRAVILKSTLFLHPSLLDPLLDGLNRRNRHYVHHFATAVCRDLVSFDQHDCNPFRAVVPLLYEFDFLKAVIVATGAMHLAALHGYQNLPERPELVDALVAKGKAIRLLRSAVDKMTPENQAMVLAATVFLINLDLIDSGKGGWQVHMEAASALMSSLRHPAHGQLDQGLMACVDAIAADCLTYRVFGSAISGVTLTSWAEHDPSEFLSILKRAEAFSYHCCPPEILHILLSASSLCSRSDHSRVEEDALSLIHQARSLNLVEWVQNIHGLSTDDDLDIRLSIALAHRATACLYILLAVPEVIPFPSSVVILIEEVLGYLAAVPIDHIHLKGTVWPTFVVGAQTDDPMQRAWCIARMEAVWTTSPWICPWGYIRTAMQMLHSLWDARDREPAREGRQNWLLELKSMREKCLIV